MTGGQELIITCFINHSLIMLAFAPQGWRYNPRGFEDVFQPLSNSCLVETGGNIEKYPGSEDVSTLMKLRYLK